MFASKLTARRENKVNLKNKTFPELQKLLERQDQILSNNRLVDSLSDKGEKLKNFRTQIKVELDNRHLYDMLCKDISSLDIDQNQVAALEWTGKQCKLDLERKNGQSNIDDKGDVLKMFVTHSGIHQNKIVIKEKSEEPLIKPSDLIDRKSNKMINQLDDEYQNVENNIEPYAKNLCGRIDTHSIDRVHLLLNKPIKPNVHSAVKTKPLSLKESVLLQISHENKVKDLKVNHSVHNRTFVKFKTSNYRDVKPFVEDTSDENDDEVLTNDES